jgi:methyl-accepting chemotaxis protein
VGDKTLSELNKINQINQLSRQAASIIQEISSLLREVDRAIDNMEISDEVNMAYNKMIDNVDLVMKALDQLSSVILW